MVQKELSQASTVNICVLCAQPALFKKRLKKEK